MVKLISNKVSTVSDKQNKNQDELNNIYLGICVFINRYLTDAAWYDLHF